MERKPVKNASESFIFDGEKLSTLLSRRERKDRNYNLSQSVLTFLKKGKFDLIKNSIEKFE
ncbi:hypothetical protein CH371_07370 [Leptospira wolffii]|uniref:Uncharacterized protein n=1 Tax=Leptospira wolffii TaxID=409998 RepID=A0A2M9ZH95_9LEPT|nr:hypothetical protein CH371_07370 [Leptospira wolffii]